MASQLTDKEQELLLAVQKNTKGMDTDSLLRELPSWSAEDIMLNLNQLSAKQYVDFITTGKDKKLAFRAKDTHEILATSKMNEYERIMYRLIKDAKDTGIWIKDLKTRSGMHHQLATTTIKNLEKQNIIKSVRPVKTPFKRVYLLYEVEPSSELTGGAWYTDNELDVDFIEQLSGMIFKFIQAKSLPKNPDALYPADYAKYPNVLDVHKFIEISKITTFKLSLDDVSALVDRLYYEGKIIKVVNPLASNIDDNDDDNYSSHYGERKNNKDKVESSQMHCYKAIRGTEVELQRTAFTNTPCGKCPVFDFCQSDGPLNPATCEYYNKWLSF